jgi:hypothetical protein
VSYWDDHEFDPYGDECDYEEHNVKCKYCGRTGLEWVELTQGWRLFDADGDMHQCNRNDDPKIIFASPLDKS